MIFVTVGTHEQPFNRLLQYVENLKIKEKILDEVIMQIGFSTYEIKYCKSKKLLPYNEMEKYVADARIVITHGGPASFIMPLQIGKIPIVVPRHYEFGEHINNHQLEFVKEVSQRMGTIIPIFDINKLGDAINNYDSIVASMKYSIRSNNKKFNEELDLIVKSMF